MAEVIRLPRMSDTMEEGNVVGWQKKVGDTVKSGDVIAEVETDKATMELECYQEGVLLYIAVEKGKVAVDGVLAVIGEKGEDYKTLLQEETASKAGAVAAPSAVPAASVSAPLPGVVPSAVPAAESTDRLKASPLAKKIAQDKGIDLSLLTGSGDSGRIIKRDVESAAPAGLSVATAAAYTDMPLTAMRKTIAQRLSKSVQEAPHFFLTAEMDMGEVVALRNKLKEQDIKVSFNDIVVKAVALSLKEHPMMNASWLGEVIRVHHDIHIAIAIAVEEGLLVPVLRHADQKTLLTISKEIKILAQKAKDKTLVPADWSGNTFTISNLGMFGIEQFTAIINTPDAGILAVGAIVEKPVVKKGLVEAGYRMKVTLSGDHRVIDGAVGAAFLRTLKQYLEQPLLMI